MEVIINSSLLEKKRGISVGVIVLAFLIIVLSCLLIMMSLCSLCRVKGDSMLVTLEDKQYVLMAKTSKAVSGDIVIFYHESTNTNYIKRVIAVGGETLRFVLDESGKMKTQKKSGDTFSDIREDYIREAMTVPFGMKFSLGEEITVPADHYFVMGDNRNHSEDSRYSSVGMVSSETVEGRAIRVFEIGSAGEWFMKLIFFTWMKE